MRLAARAAVRISASRRLSRTVIRVPQRFRSLLLEHDLFGKPVSTFPDHALVLLCHKFLRGAGLAIGAAQHGHRGNVVTRAVISLRRIVAIEFGTCRSGRSGGASGSVTAGNGKFRELPGG